jgi:hypothetical protein
VKRRSHNYYRVVNPKPAPAPMQVQPDNRTKVLTTGGRHGYTICPECGARCPVRERKQNITGGGQHPTDLVVCEHRTGGGRYDPMRFDKKCEGSYTNTTPDMEEKTMANYLRDMKSYLHDNPNQTYTGTQLADATGCYTMRTNGTRDYTLASQSLRALVDGADYGDRHGTRKHSSTPPMEHLEADVHLDGGGRRKWGPSKFTYRPPASQMPTGPAALAVVDLSELLAELKHISAHLAMLTTDSDGDNVWCRPCNQQSL